MIDVFSASPAASWLWFSPATPPTFLPASLTPTITSAPLRPQLVVETPPPAPAPKPKAKPKEEEKAVAPKIAEPMKGLIVVEGQAAMFRCRFSGHPGRSTILGWMER